MSAPRTDVLEAVRFLARDERDHAIKLLTDTHRADPADFRVTHALALMTLWQLVDGERTDWRLCIGLWANLVAQPGFWTWFTEDAVRRYRTDVPESEVDGVRERLERWLHDTVTRCADGGTAALLALEMRAARLVAVRGGIPAGATGSPIPCGPLLIDHLELHDACRDLVARLQASKDERNRRTAQYFSTLGPARMLLDRGTPLAALRSLENLHCADCPATGEAPRMCRPGCPAFARRNPAYAHAVGGRKRLRAEAVAMIVEAHLSVAESAIAAQEPDLRTAIEHWKASIRQGAADAFRRHLDEIVLPRARFFLQKRRHDEAIDVLTALPIGTATAVFGDDFGDATRMLSEQLAQRGIEGANRRPPETGQALADLRRAAQLNPSSWYACRNLAVVLQNTAGLAVPRSNPADHHFVAAVELLEEARTVMRLFPRTGKGPEIDERLGQISAGIGAAYNAQAVQALERGDHDHALELVARALRERPNDPVMLQNQAVIRQSKAYRNRTADEVFGLPGKRGHEVRIPPQIRQPAHRPKESRWRRATGKIKGWFTGGPR